MPRALIVDDKPDNLYLLAALLAGHGYQVDQAHNGKEALSLAMAKPPDLVISDILMPGMDGFALCREWKQAPQLQGIPFVFYTATYTDLKDEQFALSLGADLYMVKPQEPDVFMNRITVVLQRCQRGQLLRPAAVPIEESVYLREYNAALVHKLEDKLEQLERVSKVKDALLSSVSHELRTPLTPAMLLVDLLVSDSSTPPQIRDDLIAIRRHIEIEKYLISDLLDYAAMHAGALRLCMRPLSLHTMAEQAIALWQEQIRAGILRLDLHLDASCDQVLGDQERLEQVLWNLIRHAVCRTPQRGSITFRTWNPQPDCVALEVRDTGRRMSAQIIAWVFSPLEHAVRLGEGAEQETGLGLAVAKGIIESHGGTISIENNGQDSGITVVVQLPVPRAEHQSVPQPNHSAAR